MNEIGQTEEFVQWFDKLRDQRVSKLIQARIKRFSLGNLGDIRGLVIAFWRPVFIMGLGTVYILFSVKRHEYCICFGGVANTLKGRILKRQKIWR